ncbi:MAG TPA: hypothetical protein VGD33_06740, partial [Chitinophagaceae bacterium]
MQRNFTNDDLERFLKRSADGLRMRPSDKVWKAVSQNLNQRRRRITYAAFTLLIVTSLISYLVIDSPKPVLHPLTASIESITNSAINTVPSRVPMQASNERTSAATIPQVASVSIPLSGTPDLGSLNTFTSDHIINPVAESGITSQAIDEFESTIVDSDPSPASIQVEKNDAAIVDHSDKLLGIESVTNAFRGFKKNKLSFQLFFTPTVSYRKLSENKSYLRSSNQLGAPPQIAALYNINDLVTHKPSMGLELGFAAKYDIAKSIKLRGGLQFNMSRYDIKAFEYTQETATIALNNGGNNVDYLDQETIYRRVGTNSNVNWLENLYFQVSAPVGLEVKIHSTKNAKFGIASTVQPTYVLSDRAYLLSYDYKNYTEVPWLIRRWNV